MYRKNDSPGSTIVKIDLSIDQVKVLDALVSSELADVEQGYSGHEEKPLQRLTDLFYPILHIKLTPAEEAAEHAKARERNLAAGQAYKDKIIEVRIAQEAL